MEILFFVLQCIYFMLPAYFANMAPVMARGSFKELKVPIDFNTKVDNHTIFGKNKTFRGLIFGILLGILVTFTQYMLYDLGHFMELSFIDYSNWLTLGFLFGSGAIIGDLIKSFFKRRLNIKPGKPFIPFDQLDFVIGSVVFVYPVYHLTIYQVVTMLLVSFFLHILVNHGAYYLNIRKEKW